MLRELGFKHVAIASLVLPGDFEKTMESAEVKQRAESVRVLGVLQPPIIRWSDKRLIAGVRRTAAAKRIGRRKIYVKAIECTDEEAQMIIAAENYEREHNERAAMDALVELVELYADQLKREGGFQDEKKGRGAKMTERGRARRLVAAATGKSENAIRQADYRNRLKVREEGQLPVPEEPPIDTYGMRLDDTWSAEVAEVQRQMRQARAYVSQAQGHLTKLGDAGLGVGQRLLAPLKSLASELSGAIQASMPAAVCPYCKGIDGLSGDCAICRGFGAVPASVKRDSPVQLTREEPLLVVKNGAFVTIEEALSDE